MEQSNQRRLDMSFILGIAIGILAMTQIFAGATLKYHKREDIDTINFDVVSRKDNQGYFWLFIAIQVIIAFIFVTGIIRF
jgi:hypothetical protein